MQGLTHPTHVPTPDRSEGTGGSDSEREGEEVGLGRLGDVWMTGVWVYLAQVRAIVLRFRAHQARQTISNTYQVLHPLLCLFVLWLVAHRMAMHKDVAVDSRVAGEVPMFFNLPSLLDRAATANPLAASDCHRHFVVRTDPAFPIPEPDIRAILANPFAEYCPSIGQFVPFVEFTPQDISAFLFERLERVDDAPLIDLAPDPATSRRHPNRQMDLSQLPDGGFFFHRLDPSTVSATLHVNDLLFMMYHRDNGFSLLTFRVPEFSLDALRRLAKDTLAAPDDPTDTPPEDWTTFFYRHVLRPPSDNATWFQDRLSHLKGSIHNATSRLRTRPPSVTVS